MKNTSYTVVMYYGFNIKTTFEIAVSYASLGMHSKIRQC